MSTTHFVVGESAVSVELPAPSGGDAIRVATVTTGDTAHRVAFRSVAGPRGALALEVDGKRVLLWTARVDSGVVAARHVSAAGRCEILIERSTKRRRAGAGHEDGDLSSPMPGTVLDVRVGPGDVVEKGAVLVVIEAMKMEHSVAAPRAGTVKAVHVAPGDRTTPGQALVDLE